MPSEPINEEYLAFAEDPVPSGVLNPPSGAAFSTLICLAWADTAEMAAEGGLELERTVMQKRLMLQGLFAGSGWIRASG